MIRGWGLGKLHSILSAYPLGSSKDKNLSATRSLYSLAGCLIAVVEVKTQKKPAQAKVQGDDH